MAARELPNCSHSPALWLWTIQWPSFHSFRPPAHVYGTIQRLRRWLLSVLGYPTPSRYVQHPFKGQHALGTPYLLIEYINPSRGKPLTETWEEGRHDPKLRSNLFHGLSRMILTLARTPLPKIGSFTLDKNGYLSLSNRPLTLEIQ
ncbi:hypothetical protein ASPCAL12493 [Aspergillus calidoustus]|uniref:Aminoglycoside phosphotransferase domain-containing protein n=1 Tax=Aspergillus calidoustus TaxID=454130 RepID=A0A0U5CFW9_ASPCI|nr:hypothetical protein ASPCAL12493 [Aspergillus calidoustus]